MDVILNDLVDQHSVTDNTDRQFCLEILNETLQSDSRSYEDFFSSRPTAGSIVEDIAEVDAHISVIERKIRAFLLENKTAVVESVLSNSKGSVLSDIRKELEQLWELDNETVSTSTDTKDDDKKELMIDEFLEQNDTTNKEQDDQFHMALQKLKKRVTKSDDDTGRYEGSLATVLENLNNATDLMELPFLSRTCIRTGHYQEAVMLYTYSKSLLVKFPGSTIVAGICHNVLTETTTTMLAGLVKLLSTNVNVNSLKKILNYLICIPPFDGNDKSSLLQVFLHMRFIFIQREISSYSLDIERPNESLLEMMVKKQIEVLREYTHMSMSVFMEMLQCTKEPISIPLNKDLTPQQQETSKETSIETNPLMLHFTNECIRWLLKDLCDAKLEGKLSDSVCLQLVYCSFRLHDLNANYHHLFLNRIHESKIFTVEQLKHAIEKRRELASKYS